MSCPYHRLQPAGNCTQCGDDAPECVSCKKPLQRHSTHTKCPQCNNRYTKCAGYGCKSLKDERVLWDKQRWHTKGDNIYCTSHWKLRNSKFFAH